MNVIALGSTSTSQATINGREKGRHRVGSRSLRTHTFLCVLNVPFLTGPYKGILSYCLFNARVRPPAAIRTPPLAYPTLRWADGVRRRALRVLASDI